MAVTITIIRDDQEIEVEASGSFFEGELEDYFLEPNIPLTEYEDDTIVNLLIDEYADDWDENDYKAERGN